VIRDMKSAPITTTLRARPDSICAAPIDSPEMKPVHADPTSNAPAPSVPRLWATSGAAFGITSSAVVVATSTRSTSSGVTPARLSALRAAYVAWVASRSSGSAMCRERMPVRRTIQSSLTPRRALISAFSTTLSGRLTPTEATAAPSSVGVLGA